LGEGSPIQLIAIEASAVAQVEARHGVDGLARSVAGTQEVMRRAWLRNGRTTFAAAGSDLAVAVERRERALVRGARTNVGFGASDPS
jgi:hypothetical protein